MANPTPSEILVGRRVFSMDEVIATLGLTLTQDDAGAAPAGKSTALALLGANGDRRSLTRPFAALSDAPVFVPRDERIRRAKAYISRIDPAISGQGGDQKTFQVAAIAARDFDLEDEDALEALAEWNERCSPPWSERELLEKVRNARRYASKDENGVQAPPGAKAAALERLSEMSAEESLALRVRRPDWTNKPGPLKGPLVSLAPSNDGEPGAMAVQGKDGETKWVKQTQPGPDQISECAPLLIHYINHLVVSNTGLSNYCYSLTSNGLAIPTTRDGLIADVVECCRAMMGGKEPAPSVHNTATDLILARPQKGIMIEPFRWAGETTLALHEIPQPIEGDWSAHKEFIDRCSCKDTIMAWTWSCFVPETRTGREALVLWGQGNDGKSYWSEMLAKFMGPAAASPPIVKGDNRFELAQLVGKRLAYFGDIRNPKAIHGRVMRELISGARLSFERKGKDVEEAYFHPRCLISTNTELHISPKNGAERSRVRRINVTPLKGNKGDLTWKFKLLDQMPAFLFACRQVYERFANTDGTIPESPACIEALTGGMAAMDDQFDFLAERLDFTENHDDFITTRRISDLMDLAKYRSYDRENARDWMQGKGARNKHENGKNIFRRTEGRNAAVWTGVKEIATGKFRDVGVAR